MATRERNGKAQKEIALWSARKAKYQGTKERGTPAASLFFTRIAKRCMDRRASPGARAHSMQPAPQ